MNDAQHEVLNLLLVVAILILVLTGVGAKLVAAIMTPDNKQLNLNPLTDATVLKGAANGVANGLKGVPTNDALGVGLKMLGAVIGGIAGVAPK